MEVLKHTEDPEPQEVNQLLRLALEKNVPVETLERLTTLYERMADRKAAQEFNGALAQFQGECPPIKKTSTASIATSSGAKYGYQYAELDEIARTIAPHLHKRGLSYTWDSSMAEGKLVCVCILRHENGHESRATFTCPTESRAGMSDQQKHASALTYAKRQALTQVLGLTCCDPDLDGGEPVRPQEKVTLDQAAYIESLIDEVKADRGRFLKWAGVPTIADIPAAVYLKAVEALEKKRVGR